MTTPRRVRFAPVWRFAVAMSRKAARMAWQNRRLRHELAVVRVERDRAREVAAALVAEPCRCTLDFAEWERSLGAEG